MSFQSPFWLCLLLLLPIWWLKRRSRHISHAQVHRLSALKSTRLTWAIHLLRVLTIIGLIALIIALARPQRVSINRYQESYGIDIIIALDTSASMRAEDFKPTNRLSIAKKTIATFIDKRNVDRIGLVVFGTDAYTLSPSTTDYSLLKQSLGRAQLDMAGPNTNIGMAIATAINRLKHSKAKSKIIILLTDGENNQTDLDPQTAATLAQTLGIKIYTVGIGKKGGARIPIQHPILGRTFQRDSSGRYVLTKLDEPTLMAIAEQTNGHYYRAYDSASLAEIYDQIDQLEKTKLNPVFLTRTRDLFYPFLLLGLGCLVLEFLLSRTLFLRLP